MEAADTNEGVEPQPIEQQQNTLIDHGRLGQAEQVLKNWISTHATEATAPTRRLELGRILFWSGKPSESKTQLENVLRERPEEDWAISMLGQIEARFGNHGSARKLFEQALQKNPSNHEAQMFLLRNPLDQAREVRRMLTHSKLSPREQIKLAQLCQATDFKSGTKPDLEKGEITEETLVRSNLMLENASKGENVESELSLQSKLDEAEEIVFYTSNALGDAILGLSAVDALAHYFETHPEKRKAVEIVTPYTEIFEGLQEKYPFIKLKKLGNSRDVNETQNYANDLNSRTKKVFAFTNAGNETYASLAATRNTNTLALVDAYIDRFSRDLHPWTSLKPPYKTISSYPAKMFRFMEILIGEKLIDRPEDYKLNLPVSRSIKEKIKTLTNKYAINPNSNFHTVVESASTVSKKFSPEQLGEVLTEMAQYCQQEKRATGKDSQILFIKDPGTSDSFAKRIALLPPEIRNSITIVQEDLQGVASLINISNTVLSPDTGLGHLAAAMGKKSLILYTMGDPYLWRTGGENVSYLASSQAQAAHDNLTPVNMPQWSDDRPITAEAFSSAEIVEKWKRMQTPLAPRRSILNLFGIRRAAPQAI